MGVGKVSRLRRPELLIINYELWNRFADYLKREKITVFFKQDNRTKKRIIIHRFH